MPVHSPVDPVSKWRDHKSGSVAQVLVTVGHLSGNHPHPDIPVHHVISQLGDPVEVGLVIRSTFP